MTQEDLNEKIEKLEKKKSAFTRNRNICALATVFLGYNYYDTIQLDTPPLWYLILMSIIVLACAGLGLYGHRMIKSSVQELAELYKELQACNEEIDEE